MSETKGRDRKPSTLYDEKEFDFLMDFLAERSLAPRRTITYKSVAVQMTNEAARQGWKRRDYDEENIRMSEHKYKGVIRHVAAKKYSDERHRCAKDCFKRPWGWNSPTSSRKDDDHPSSSIQPGHVSEDDRYGKKREYESPSSQREEQQERSSRDDRENLSSRHQSEERPEYESPYAQREEEHKSTASSGQQQSDSYGQQSSCGEQSSPPKRRKLPFYTRRYPDPNGDR